MTRPCTVDPELLRFATVRQKLVLDAVIKHGSARKAGEAIGIQFSHIARTVKAVKKRAARQGFAPECGMTHEAPPPFVVKGVSTLYDELGNQRLQWVKTKLDEQQAAEAVKEWVDWLVKDAKALSPLVRSPKATLSDLLAVYPFGDPHFGMYAWAQEAGDDFDLETAERLTLGAVDSLLSSAPSASTAILLLLGDVFHADDSKNMTPGHGNILDVDSRYPKVLLVGIKTFRHAILRALEKHEKVIVRVEPGNHDPHAKWALVFSLMAYFENNPRVTIDISPSKFWFYRFGKVLIGSTHGDTVKHEGLPGVMAADRAEDWGVTKHRYWYTGHVHITAVREFPGVTCESFRTLAAKDAWTSGRGYRAGRDMRCIVHHKDFGEVARHRCDISMIA